MTIAERLVVIFKFLNRYMKLLRLLVMIRTPRMPLAAAGCLSMRLSAAYQKLGAQVLVKWLSVEFCRRFEVRIRIQTFPDGSPGYLLGIEGPRRRGSCHLPSRHYNIFMPIHAAAMIISTMIRPMLLGLFQLTQVDLTGGPLPVAACVHVR